MSLIASTYQYEYIIKLLGHQELGSQQFRGGPSSRGRYILMSKAPEIQSLLPPLSSAQENDAALITITRIDRPDKRRYYCNYVYHNSQVVFQQKNGRNEFRIYLSKAVDDGLFFENDIIVMRADQTLNNQRGVTRGSQSTYDYLLASYRPGDPEYLSLRDKLNLGNFGIYKGFLPEFEQQAQNALLTEPTAIVAPDTLKQVGNLCQKSTEKQTENKTLALHEFMTSPSVSATSSNPTPSVSDQFAIFSNYFNSLSFRAFVMTNYNNTCAVTKEVIAYGELNNLEAAHIHPKCQGGQFLPSNGIAMRRDIHWAFDKGMFYISNDLKVYVAEEVRDSYLGKYHGTTIMIPRCEFFAPNPTYLEYHRKNIYGLFKNAGVMKGTLC
jgi:hypothetical protein